MEMREIEAFLAVADELHFGRAAQRLLVTPSHVSQTIRRLETRVGAPLFERTSRRVRLTPLGEQFLAQVRPAYQALSRALADAQHNARPTHRDRDFLRVGFSTTLDPDLTRQLVDAFEDTHPSCRLVRSDRPATDIYRCLDSGELTSDTFVCWFPYVPPDALPTGIRTGPPIRQAQRSVLMADTHPLADQTVIDIEELADYDVSTPPDSDRSPTPGRHPPPPPAGSYDGSHAQGTSSWKQCPTSSAKATSST